MSGTSEDGSNFRIGKSRDAYPYHSNIVLYAAELYDRDLTAEEIQQVSDRMLAEWYEKAYSPLAAPYQALWTENGKTNQDVNKNVPNLIDPANPLLTINFAWSGNSGYTEQGLHLDGVNDKVYSSKGLGSLQRYTVIADLTFLSTDTGYGISKLNNWYMYMDRVYIGGTSVSYYVRDAIGITSSGLVVTKIGADITNKIGTAASTNSVQSTGYKRMIFRSLAIIPYELNEAQIRETYEYLKTIKANNI